jgi:hypothetical protein
MQRILTMPDTAFQEIALRHRVPDERISEILTALDIEENNPSEFHLKHFEQVCALMQSGFTLELAAQCDRSSDREAEV